MIAVVIAGLFWLVAIGFGLLTIVDWKKEASRPGNLRPRTPALIVLIVCLFLGGLTWIAGSFNSVGTKDVGIITAFGKTEGHVGPGLHLLDPWQNVTTMDAAIQTDGHTGQNDCIDVRIANQQTACVSTTIRWRIRETAADSLFQNYRTFGNVRDSLVTKEFQQALNDQLVNYNPLNSITLTGVPSFGAKPNPPLATIAGQVLGEMRKDIGTNIEVLSVFVPIIYFDKETQARINQLQQQVAKTRVAEQQEQTNEAQSKANDALAKSVNTSPNVLVAECINGALAQMAAAGTVPVGFSCWPSSTGVGGVIVNGSTQPATSTATK